MQKALSILVITLLLLGSLSSFAGDKEKKKKKKKETATMGISHEQKMKIDKFYFEAEKAKALEDWSEALKNYQEVVNLDPKNSNGWFQLAQLYLSIQRYNEAIDAGSKASDLDPSNKWYLQFLANIYLQQGNYKDAGRVYEKLIEKAPNNPDYFLDLAYMYIQNNQFDKAIELYNRFEKSYGLEENVVMQKYKIFIRQQKFDLAAEEVKKLVNEYPEDTRYLNILGELYMNTGKKSEALEIYKKILSIDPSDQTALLAVSSLENNGGPVKKEDIRKLIENPKINAETKIKLLYPYIEKFDEKSPDAKDAIELIQMVTKMHPDDAAAWALQGDFFYLNDQLDEAVLAYKKSLEKRKDIYQVWQQLLTIYNEQRKWQELLDVCNETVELYPNQPLVYLYKGNAENQLKLYDKALKSFSKGEKMSFENKKLKAQFLVSQGDVYHSMNRHTESDSAYEQSLKLDPDNAYALNNYSYYLSLRKENLQRAAQMSDYSNKLEPNNASFQDTYAWILFCQGKYNEAKTWQEKALKNGGEKSGTVLEHYGDILFKLGDTVKAMEYWKKAQSIGDDISPVLQKKIVEGKFVE